MICGTDTLGVGINVPIRTVLFTALSKYDGTKTRLLQAREFHQIAGRAGRAGYDTAGTVVVQAPEHVVENEQALAKAGDDAKKRRKVVRKKPPEGFVSWGQPTFERLVAAEPEPLKSRFAVSHAMLLNVMSRPGDAFAAMKHLLTDNHEDRAAQRAHIHRAIADLPGAAGQRRGREAGGAGRAGPAGAADRGPAVRLRAQPAAVAVRAGRAGAAGPGVPRLPAGRALGHRVHPGQPRQVLSAQQFRARGEAVAQMKADGVDYETRMELLDSVTYPKPLEELLGAAFGIYRRGHPWVDDHELAPKSVVRDMYERSMTFTEYIGFYGLSRSEGLVLRYLADAYKALRQTVPEDGRTEELIDLIEWLGELVRQVDSSLIDEWERLRNPDPGEFAAAASARPALVTGNVRAFRVLVRNALFRRVTLAALGRYDELGELDADSGWDAGAWGDVLDAYFDEHDEIGTGPDARGPGLLILAEGPSKWTARQIFDDPAGNHDWGISAEIDLAASDEAGTAVLRVTDAGQL